jgi:putative tryptophan/tyrosine transport system substrate-binding protein
VNRAPDRSAHVDLRHHPPYCPDMDRRRFLLTSLAGALAAPLAGDAQQAEKAPRVGVINPLSAAAASGTIAALNDGLRQLGYIQGQSIALDYHYLEGNFDLIPSVVDGLVKAGARVLVVGGTTPAIAVAKATTAVPIAFVGVSDPVGAGLAVSLARPGRSATGVATAHEDAYAGKSLELLKEIVPSASRVAVLHNPANPFNVRFMKEVERVAMKLSVRAEPTQAQTPAELESALSAITRSRPDALLVVSDPFLVARRTQVVASAIEHRLPAMFGFKEYVTAGGLMSYGASLPDMYRAAARYVDKILKGAKPADLPIEQPTTFELVINLKTAKALGLTIPPSLLARADQVIE